MGLEQTLLVVGGIGLQHGRTEARLTFLIHQIGKLNEAGTRIDNIHRIFRLFNGSRLIACIQAQLHLLVTINMAPQLGLSPLHHSKAILLLRRLASSKHKLHICRRQKFDFVHAQNNDPIFG